MILRLTGHDYKYAVEQIMLMLFPAERPVYADSGDGDGGLSADVTLTRGGTYAVATTVIRSGGDVSRGVSRVPLDRLTDELEADRQLQRIIKQSFFKAAVKLTDARPEWGSLTGIRPAKLAAGLLERGQSERRIVKTLTSEYYVSPARAQLCVDAARAGLEIKRTLKWRDAALYVGIPFCPTRCAYCSFVSHSVEKSLSLIAPFLQALLTEIDAAALAARELGLSIVAVYLGGGTPTTLSAAELDTLMGRLRERFDLTGAREYTVEAGRPDTIDAEKLRVMKSHGATRVSVNPQSLSDDVLRAIGRRHTASDVLRAVSLVRQCGGLALNMDVIAGLPGDTAAGFRATLDAVMAQNPENVTVHTLSLKKGSGITLSGTTIPDGGEVSAMLDYAAEQLRSDGYSPYYLYRQKFTSGGFENTGWSRPGYEGVYNVCMMEEQCTVLALGGGGVTKLVSPDGGRIERIFNVKYPYEYIERIEELVRKKALIKEFYVTEGSHVV